MLRLLGKAVVAGMAFLMVGCAQVGSPDGGGRDEAAPRVVAADPPFGTVQFDQGEFILEFDEFVQLQDARRQMLVSPPLPALPKALVRGRSVKVELGDSLMGDRTYIVQFGDAVRDLREGNVAKGLQYVFSTGAVLDSGRVAGRAEDAWSGEASAGTRVLLFDGGLPEGVLDADLPDSIRPLPDYVGLVDDSGRFEVGFLPITVLGWMVVDDANGNYRADHGESVGWGDSLLQTVTDSAGLLELMAAPPLMLDAPPPVASTYLSGVLVDSSGYFRAAISGLDVLREGPDGLTDADIKDSVVLTGPDGPVDFGLEGDSVWAMLPGFEAGEGGPWLLRHLSGTDTLVFRDIRPNAPPVPVGAVERFADRAGHFGLRFAPRPEVLDTALCSGTVVLNGDTFGLSSSLFTLEGNRLDVGPLPLGSSVSLMIAPGGIQGATGLSTDTLEWRLSVRAPSDFGTIQLLLDSAVHASGEEVIWMLLNGSGAPTDFGMNAEGRFEALLPGRYRLVMVWDENGDGRWSGARPADGLHPESVYRWAEEVDVRAGWEVEIAPGFHPRP
jgi:hypothetical protein